MVAVTFARVSVGSAADLAVNAWWDTGTEASSAPYPAVAPLPQPQAKGPAEHPPRFAKDGAACLEAAGRPGRAVPCGTGGGEQAAFASSRAMDRST